MTTPTVVVPVTDEPKSEKSHREKRSRAGSMMKTSSGREEEVSRLRGLSSLAVANLIHITVDKQWWKCDWNTHYSISDCETEALIFTAVEAVNCCCGGNLQNILIRDHTRNPVARVCYKEKACCSKHLVMAVYAPADLLVGTIDESTGFLGSTEFIIRNSDGNPLFSVDYKSGMCPFGSWCCGWSSCTCGSHFKVKSYETKSEVGKILEKTNHSMRLQFKTKLDITGKIILTGFCIGLVHKSYNQVLLPRPTSDE